MSISPRGIREDGLAKLLGPVSSGWVPTTRAGEGMAEQSDNETVGLFNSIYERFSYGKLPSLLAHYTSIRVVESILSNEEIWFSNPLFMNDLQEMRFGLHLGTSLFSDSELLKQAGGTDARVAILQHAYAQCFQQFENQRAFDTYVFCLSEHDGSNTDGLLSMWRGYGQHGNGAALVFDPAKLTMVPSSPLLFAQVSYGTDEERTQQLATLLRQWAEISERIALPDERLYLAASCAFMVVKAFALTTKHRGFSEEAEWRVIYYPERDSAGALKPFFGYHVGERGIEPKLKYPIGYIANVSAPDLALDRLLHKIILGPSLSSPLAKKGVERMLESIKKSNYVERLHPSGIPLRPNAATSFFR